MGVVDETVWWMVHRAVTTRTFGLEIHVLALVIIL